MPKGPIECAGGRRRGLFGVSFDVDMEAGKSDPSPAKRGGCMRVRRVQWLT
jgi:hypothetical protein